MAIRLRVPAPIEFTQPARGFQARPLYARRINRHAAPDGVHHNVGEIPNPYLSPKIQPLGLTDDQIEALVAFMQPLEGQGYMDTPPVIFP